MHARQYGTQQTKADGIATADSSFASCGMTPHNNTLGGSWNNMN